MPIEKFQQVSQFTDNSSIENFHKFTGGKRHHKESWWFHKPLTDILENQIATTSYRCSLAYIRAAFDETKNYYLYPDYLLE